MTDTDRPATIAKIAAEAIQREGAAAYFPDLDPETFDPAAALAEAMRKHPDDWVAPTDDSAWVCYISKPDLIAAAEALGARYLGTPPTVESLTHWGTVAALAGLAATAVHLIAGA